MRYNKIIFIGSIFLISQILHAQSTTLKSKHKTTDRIIIKYKTDKKLTDSMASSLLQNIKLSGSKAVKMKSIRQNTLKANIFRVNVDGDKPTIKEIEELAKKLSKQPNIEYAEPDYIRQIMKVPNDTFYPTKHWHLQDTPGGANLEGAWDITTGKSTDVIAVIDTGIIYHSDLAGKILPGYDFIGDTSVANDGDGRDDDASDPGDNDDPDDQYGSSWHGTHVSGTIAALSDNSDGITGINWNGKILPVRVLGVGGGYISDIIDGMLWSAGLHVNNVPDNPNPAKVLNLSLGGGGSCSNTEQNAIDTINNTGAIIVVAAGNENSDAINSSPGNCNGVITVAASAKDGGRAYYSNYGNIVEITAPGGDKNKDSMIYSTLDGGKTSPANDDAYAAYQGTSMATPHIAGISSLIASILDKTNYDIVLSILQGTSKKFPTGTGNDCTTSTCGAGIVDATAAIVLASNPKPHYNDILAESNSVFYDFSSSDHKVDTSSLWSIIDGKLTSNDITDDQSTSYRLDIPGQAFTISFDYSVDAEEDYDGLLFEQEGTTVFNKLARDFNGTYNGKTIAADGKLNLKWTYHKDSSVSDGADNASIDNISIEAYTYTSYNFLKDGSKKKILIITNSGLDELIIDNMALSNSSDFDVENLCTNPLKYKESCTITVNYTSPYNPMDSTTLSYNTNDTNNPTITKIFNVGNTTIAPIVNYILQ